MAHDVNKALEEIAAGHGGLGLGAKNWVKKLKGDGRYFEDVWS
jgi:sulfite reductase alpha subunit-like flavoprotein